MDTDLPFTLDGTNVMTLKDDSCITEDFIGIAGKRVLNPRRPEV